ncbi:TPA: BLUF domain-containing protein [Stenotrophomonas maltophilia]|nr:BLUF domain-containing protein [Stenotrophomonas maltophilia]HDS1024654.1 BLUF domain-containing protein [Stenotrophomonas maltophilia]HDS1029038.1 BLUF domain-containing protein [Stenotrophomonas maltophilia]HDS1033606.1 BLUF domain-containing protein [Stenotrophomonas maltophilia]
MPKCAVVFVSSAVEDVDPERLADVMAAGAAFNQACDSHAVVCFDGSRFLTYLEGSASSVAATFVYVESVAIHSELVELARGPIQQLRFSDQSLHFMRVSTPQLKSLVRADWKNFSQRLKGQFEPETGLERLADLVAQHCEPAVG